MFKSNKVMLTISNESKDFLNTLSKLYQNKILESLSPIQKSFEKITPTNISLIIKKNINKSNSNTEFLNNISKCLIKIILKKAHLCSIEHNQKKIYPSCIILAIAKDKDLTKLSNRIGILIPSKIINNNDTRTTKELYNSLNFKGIENFSRQELLFLSQPYKNTIYNDYIKWLFSPENNHLIPELTRIDMKLIKKDNNIRRDIILAFKKLILSYGFTLDKKTIVKQINKKHKIHNFKHLIHIMNFLVEINMEYIAAIFFLVLCKISNDKEALENKTIKIWMSTLKLYNNKRRKIQCNITGLNYTGNSCYMDSVLLCLFGIKNKIITDNILNKNLNDLKTYKTLWSRCDNNIDKDIKKRYSIQKELNNITLSMRNGNDTKKCSTLRTLIKKCPGSQQFHLPLTQDAGEFLSYIFNIFQVNISTTRRRSYGSNKTEDWKLVSSTIDNNASPIIDITSTTLQNIHTGHNITKFIKQTEKSTLSHTNIWYPDVNNKNINYSKRKEVFRMLSSPLIIFNLSRTYGKLTFKKPKTKKEKEIGRGEFTGIETKEIFKEISAPETMTLHDRQLYLSSIVVHTGGAHYVANFKCNNEWYWYDDNPAGSTHKINYVGSYNEMLKTTPNPMSHGTLFFYI